MFVMKVDHYWYSYSLMIGMILPWNSLGFHMLWTTEIGLLRSAIATKWMSPIFLFKLCTWIWCLLLVLQQDLHFLIICILSFHWTRVTWLVKQLLLEKLLLIRKLQWFNWLAFEIWIKIYIHIHMNIVTLTSMRQIYFFISDYTSKYFTILKSCYSNWLLWLFSSAFGLE